MNKNAKIFQRAIVIFSLVAFIFNFYGLELILLTSKPANNISKELDVCYSHDIINLNSINVDILNRCCSNTKLLLFPSAAINLFINLDVLTVKRENALQLKLPSIECYYCIITYIDINISKEILKKTQDVFHPPRHINTYLT